MKDQVRSPPPTEIKPKLRYGTVIIEGNIHVRYIAGLAQEMLGPLSKTIINGM